MTLKLRIANLETLPDGGPVRYAVDGRGFEFGRDTGMDWTLPDPNRFVSSCHGEVRFENGGYWLYDRSTNGTFVNGSAMRVKSPYALQNGDRIQVGSYILMVEELAAPAPAAPAAAPAGGIGAPAPMPPAAPDIWSLGEAPPPMQDFDPTPPPPRRGDFGDQHIEIPVAVPPNPAAPAAAIPQAQPAPAAPALPSGDDSPFPAAAPAAAPVTPEPPAPVAPTPPPQAMPPVAQPQAAPAAPPGFDPDRTTPPPAGSPLAQAPTPMAEAPRAVPRPVRSSSIAPLPGPGSVPRRPPPMPGLAQEAPAPAPAAPEPPAAAAPPPAAAPAPTSDPSGGGFGRPPKPKSVAPPPMETPRAEPVPTPPPPPTGAAAGTDAAAILKTVAEAAGLSPDAFRGADPHAAAHEIGRSLRIMTAELTALLRVRTTVKTSFKSGERTQLNRDDNNPLKFIPSSEEALEAMFGKPRAGYMRGADAVQNAFSDIHRHQSAVFAAIQPALAEIVGDLAPETIESKVEGGAFSSKNARAWEVYVERWDAKTAPHENGMLDVFNLYFAKNYDSEVKNAKK